MLEHCPKRSRATVSSKLPLSVRDFHLFKRLHQVLGDTRVHLNLSTPLETQNKRLLSNAIRLCLRSLSGHAGNLLPLG